MQSPCHASPESLPTNRAPSGPVSPGGDALPWPEAGADEDRTARPLDALPSPSAITQAPTAGTPNFFLRSTSFACAAGSLAAKGTVVAWETFRHLAWATAFISGWSVQGMMQAVVVLADTAAAWPGPSAFFATAASVILGVEWMRCKRRRAARADRRVRELKGRCVLAIQKKGGGWGVSMTRSALAAPARTHAGS